MRKRSLLALTTAFCLLLSLMAIPSGPQLVCRITGQPMQPVMAKVAEKRSPCCDVAPAIAPSGATRYTLTHPGCCDLHQGFERLNQPAVRTASAELPPAIIAAQPVAVPLPFMADIPQQPENPLALAARPPPRSSPASPRAPPVFS